MRSLDDAEYLMVGLNRELATREDPARIRFMTSGGSWFDDDDDLRLVVFWELPDPEDSVWSREELWRYRHLVQGLFEGENVRVESYFCTREELDTGEYHTGLPIPDFT